METENWREGIVYLTKFTSRKGKRTELRLGETPDCLSTWVGRYLETERPRDAGPTSGALFLCVSGTSARRGDGRLSVRAINLLLEKIRRWHDAEVADPLRRISPLKPHDLKHTFAYRLAAQTGKDAYELERRLGHGSQRYIQRYTNPPEDVAAGYVEEF